MVIEKLIADRYVGIWRRDFSPLVAYYANQSIKGRFTTFGALHEGNVVGVLFAKANGAIGVIKHIAVTMPWRGKGIAGQLLSAALQDFWKNGIGAVEAELSEAENPVSRRILLSLGFGEARANITVVNQVNEETRAAFREYYTSLGCRLEERLLKRGFFIRSFTEAAKDELDLLRAQIGGRYPAYLHPFPRDKQVVEAGSFIVIKDGDVVSYLALTLLPGCDSIAEVSCRACAEEYQNTGVGVWTLLRTLRFVAEMRDRFDKVLFSIDAADKKLTNMIGKMPVSFPGSHIKTLVTYRIEKPE